MTAENIQILQTEMAAKKLTTEKTRDYHFDNVKGILIFLMVFGHILEFAHTRPGNFEAYVIIYSFHMPLFVFISGYFSKNVDKVRENAFSSLFVPYLLFTMLNGIILDGKVLINPFQPAFALWYLLALFAWRLVLKSVLRIRFLLILTLLVSLYIGFIPQINHIMALSRIIAFFPYFLLGYFCTGDMYKKLFKIPYIAALLGFLGLAALVVYMIQEWGFSFRIFYYSYYYLSDKMKLGSNWTGVLMRSVAYVLAPLISLCFMRIVPRKKNFVLSGLGQRTFPVLVLHYYLVRLLWNSSLFKSMTEQLNAYVMMLCCMVFAALICLICGNRYVNLGFEKVLEWVRMILFKKTPKPVEDR